MADSLANKSKDEMCTSDKGGYGRKREAYRQRDVKDVYRDTQGHRLSRFPLRFFPLYFLHFARV